MFVNIWKPIEEEKNFLEHTDVSKFIRKQQGNQTYSSLREASKDIY